MQKIFSIKIRGNNFLKNVAILMTGTVGARIIGLLAIPIISRLYSPESFGHMAMYGTVVMVIGTISCGCYEQAIVLPKEDSESWVVFLSSILICFCIFLLCMLLLVPFSNYFSFAVFKIENSMWIWFIPFGAFIYGIEMILKLWQIRKVQFKIISIGGVLGIVGKETFRIGSGFTIGDNVFGLIGALLARNLVVISILGSHFFKKEFYSIKRLPAIKEIRFVLKKYRDFPFFKCPASFLSVISKNMIIFMLAYLFDNRVVGAYGFARNLLAVPIGIFGKTVRQVFLQKAANLRANKKKVSVSFVRTTVSLIFIGIVPFGIVLLWGPELFGTLFSEKWTEAGEYAQILSPWLLSMLLNQPSFEIFTILQKQKAVLNYTVVTTVARIFVFTASYYFKFDAIRTLIIFSGVNTVLNIWIMFYAFRLAINFESKYLKPL